MNKIALLFPGQGSQYAGMGKVLCDKYPLAKKTFEEANDTLGFDLMSLCFNGSMEELTKTENTQPAILTASVAAFRVYIQEIGVEPLYLVGHSLGEITALACAGAIEFSDAVKIVRQRGKFMQEAVSLGAGAMAAISDIDISNIEEECRNISCEGDIAVISNYNASSQIVISGNIGAVGKVSENLKRKGANIIPLKVSAPFHSPLMQPAADLLRSELLKYKYNELKYLVVSNVSGLPYVSNEDIVENLSLQIIKPVQWQKSIEFLKTQAIDMVIELGPKDVLRNLIKKNVSQIDAYSLDKIEDEKVVFEKLLGKIKLSPQDEAKSRLQLIIRCLAIAVCTKNSNWDNDEYQKGVIIPYRNIQQMLEELEKSNTVPAIEQMNEALEMLRSVFVTKRVPLKEQIERFNQVFSETGMRYLLPDFEMPA